MLEQIIAMIQNFLNSGLLQWIQKIVGIGLGGNLFVGLGIDIPFGITPPIG